jgi:hypothetical protein
MLLWYLLQNIAVGSTNLLFRCEDIKNGTNTPVVRVSFEKNGVASSFMFGLHTQQWEVPANLYKHNYLILPRPSLTLTPGYLQLWEILADVPMADFLKAGDVIGFIEFFGTNEIRNVEATWGGEEILKFSNGIGLPVRDKTIYEIIRNTESILETMSQPSSALLHEYPPDEEWRQIKTKKERLLAKGFRRVWYCKSTE